MQARRKMTNPAKRYKVMVYEVQLIPYPIPKVVLWDSLERAVVTIEGGTVMTMPIPGRRRRRGAPEATDPRQTAFPVEPTIATALGDDFAPIPGKEEEQL
jgi:hypothetical protein